MVLFLFVFLFSFTTPVFGEGIYQIDRVGDCSVKISSSVLASKTKVMVEKGKEKYYYNVNNQEETIPLQLGKGIYSIKVLENISGKKYRVVDKKQIDIKEESKDLYLASNQPVYWTSQNDTIALGEEITKGLGSEEEKIKAVYDYITENIKYDYKKIKNIDDNYVPELDSVVQMKKGICYDYASLFAGMLRSQDIPTKLVKGYKNDLDAYHAWNEVLLDGKWVLVDTTYDAALKESKKKISMKKAKDDYNKVRVY